MLVILAAGTSVRLDDTPPTSEIPTLPTFTPSTGSSPGLDMLAALSQTGSQGSQPIETTLLLPKDPQPAIGVAHLHTPGPYNPAAALPPRIVKKILALEFVEMADLRADVWPDEPTQNETQNTPRRQGRPPVIKIKTWLECFARLAAVLVTRFPEKGPELWAYQSTILNAAHSYEGDTWVAYDRQYRREMLARKDLNWSVPNSRLYNEAFTGRARLVPRCQYCLSEDHGSTSCPQHPNPMFIGWLQPPGSAPYGFPQPGPSNFSSMPPTTRAGGTEICRNFNAGRCRAHRCRFVHLCAECSGQHPALSCPRWLTTPIHGAPRPRAPTRARGNPPYPLPLLPQNPQQSTGSM